MKRTNSVTTAAALNLTGLCLPLCTSAAEEPVNKTTDAAAEPNIIVVFTDDHGYADRVDNIISGSGGYLNGISLEPNSSVLADSDPDSLYGDSGKDLFFGSLGEVKDGLASERWFML